MEFVLRICTHRAEVSFMGFFVGYHPETWDYPVYVMGLYRFGYYEMQCVWLLVID